MLDKLTAASSQDPMGAAYAQVRWDHMRGGQGIALPQTMPLKDPLVSAAPARVSPQLCLTACHGAEYKCMAVPGAILLEDHHDL
jgi:hypothetical protein